MSPRSSIVNGIDVSAHGGLIARFANRYRKFVGGCLEWDDLMQAGWFGVHHAAERFDHSRGLKFSTYAQWWIRTFIQREVMNVRRTVRVPVHAQEDAYKRGERLYLDALSLNAPIDASNPEAEFLDLLRSESDPEADAVRSDATERIDAALRRLEPAERRAIKGRFWGDYTLAQIGDDVGVSRERIRQREASALEKLERPLVGLKTDV